MSEQEKVRVAINMAKADYESLRAMAESENETISGYLRKALATERYLKDRSSKGGKIIVEEDGVQREIVFR